MAIRQRKPTNVLLSFKVLHFVSQLRRRARPRVQRGSDDDPQLVNGLSTSRKALRRFSEGLSRLGARNATQPQHIANRICKCRKDNQKPFSPTLRLRTLGLDGFDRSNESGEEVQHMLGSVDERLSPTGETLSATASDNKLFLKHVNTSILDGCSLNDIVRLLVTAHDAINTLSYCRLQFSDNWLAAQGRDFGLNIDEVFVANYEHLLLRLQAELIEALERKALDELQQGGHDKKQQRLLSWFTEFAEKPRPLSTSFPWTIKPSLAVLWGVCWMFYNSSGTSSAGTEGSNDRVPGSRVLQHLDVPWDAPGSSEYFRFGLELIGLQPQPTAQQLTGDDLTVGPGSDVFEARNADHWSPEWQPFESRHPSLTYAQLSPIGSWAPTAPPNIPGALALTAFAQQLSPNSLDQSRQLPYSSLPQHSPRHLANPPQTPSIRVTGTAGTGDEAFAPPHSDFAAWNYISPSSGPPRNSNSSTNFDLFNMGNTLPPVNVPSIQLPQDYNKHQRSHSMNSNPDLPTPVSMSGPHSALPSPIREQRTTMSSPHAHARQLSEEVSSQDEHDGSLRKNNAYKRAEEPPRNQEAKMVCKHQECSGLTFDRKCEWSKHMDKHDRPYKCLVKGCEKLQGFTYSGGLLRHEREVHKMHGGTKKSLFCPFTDCKRSSGAGFTRKENLAEHIRRVHRRTSMSADMHGLVIRRETLERSPTVESRQASESPYVRNLEYRESEEPSLKRKRVTDSVLSDRADEDLRAEIKRLRHENEEKDARLRQLEQAVMALQQSRR
ncbi:uncharacterized protein EKO05_0005292 [Ascochyta rabiei]|uniref:uncharacterized protein n=1 Tax=Didymella rabiei TaxID=5454 RepID=UPI0022033BDD|nr:uncharacterized protein EKO05_0005292 [Ascochyta rabiei]UPX14821.1 hypothetical protein EKO05_0005292 [Ascochyta rabiei]